MPVGTQKDYYAILGVDRNAKPEQIRKAFHRPCGNSKVSVDFLPVGDGMNRENSQSDAAGRSGEMRVQRARLRERAKSRLKSSHGRVLPDRCSFRALRSLRSRTGLCTIRKSSKALCHSSIALPARSHLLYRSEGISTVWPMLQSPLRVSQIRTRSKCSPHLGGRVSSATSIWPLGTGR